MTDDQSKCPELPASPGRIVLTALAALLLGGGVAYCWRYPHRAECVAVAAVRATVVCAPRDGTVTEFTVPEGEPVQAGTPLLRLADPEIDQQLALKQEQIATLQRELELAEAKVRLELEWRLRTIHAEICEVQLRSASFLKEQYDYELKRNYYADLIKGDDLALMGATAAFETLVSRGRSSGSERLTAVMHMEAAANAAEVSAAQVEICDQQVRRLEELKKKLPDQVRQSAEVDVVAGRLQQAQAELKQMQSRAEELVVTAPAIGRVGVFQVRRGDVVRRGAELVELLDPAQQYLIAHVPSQQIASFRKEETVRLRFPGRVMRVGRVSSIAPQTSSGTLGLTGTDATILVHIEPAGDIWPEVPVGTQVVVVPMH